MTSTTDHKHSETVGLQKTTSTTAFGPLAPQQSITDTFTQREKIFQLRQLAQDLNQQRYLIANKKCMHMLTQAIQESISNTKINKHVLETCIASLQTFQLLAINPKYRPILEIVPNLITVIETLSISKEVSDSRISENAQLLLKTIKIKKRASQTFKPQPLQIIEITITNMSNEKDRDVIQTIGIKINGIVSVTANMQTQLVTFYCTRKNVQKILMNDLRLNGFVIVTDTEKESNINYPTDDVISTMSVHTSVSNFTDSKRGKLSSLRVKTQTGPEYIDGDHIENSQTINGYRNRTGITRYGTQIHAQSLRQRLQIEEEKKEIQKKKITEGESLFAQIVRFIW